MTHIRIILLVSATLGVVIGLASVAAAQSKCDAAKAKAAGGAVAAQMKCHAKALTKGTAVDSECLSKALDKLTTKYTNAETKTDCANVGDSTQANQQIAEFVAAFFAGGNDALTCCQIAGGGLCYDVRGQGLHECQTLMGPDGLDGAASSFCDAQTGTCAESAQGGNCCGLPDDNTCRAGPSVTETDCVDDRGLYMDGGVCQNSFCIAP